ncbi:tol-pal system protein YbgF [uncultured Enterovirga sp.]|uniref:tol-pal system protein YbgF n=1 Tax=uncultured Enterovirga sp. TaxID=2026352 RepID=UPI0035C956D9
MGSAKQSARARAARSLWIVLRTGGAAVLLVACLAVAPGARAQDGSEFIVRLNRVEGQMRQLSGQVEQLQFENRQLKDQLRKFQEDVEFRFQERGSKAGASPSAAPPAAKSERPSRRSDAFDPAQSPESPGAPRTLGSASAAPAQAETGRGGSEQRAGGTPSRGSISSILDEDEDRPGAARPLDLGAAARGGGAAAASQGGRSSSAAAEPPGAPPRGATIASSSGDDPKADYDIAYAYLMQRQYDQSEASFRRFIQSHPRDRLVPDAMFWLGESYLQRSKPREAAEQFLKVSTEHARSGKGPDAMLKLGISLAALGAKDQACATFAELERKHPGASASVKQGVDREQKRVRCPT